MREADECVWRVGEPFFAQRNTPGVDVNSLDFCVRRVSRETKHLVTGGATIGEDARAYVVLELF